MRLWVILLVILLVFGSFNTYAQFIENQDDEYLMDLWTGSFSIDWEDEWDNHPTAFRLSVGCFNMQNLYTYYELKVERPLWRGLHFKYRYVDKRTLGSTENGNDFYLDYRFSNGLYGEVLMRPLFDKKSSDGGIGLGYWKDHLNYLVPYVVLNDLDNNYSFTHAKDKKLYTEQPYTFGLKSRWKSWTWFDYWIDLAYRKGSVAEYSYESFPDSNRTERRGESSVSGLFRVTPREGMSCGVRGSWSLSHHRVEWESQASPDSSYRENILNVEPFLTLKQGEKVREEIGFQVYREADSVGGSFLERNAFLPSLLVEYRFNPQFWLHGAYARSDVKAELSGEGWEDEVERTDNRVILALQWNVSNKARLMVRKGLDLDIKDRIGVFFYDKVYLHFLISL